LIRNILFVLTALALAPACIPNDTFQAPPTPTTQKCAGPVPGTMRVASYNIASGQKSSLDEIINIIGQISPDIIALQEINVGAAGGDGRDQPQVVADKLGYQKIYAATVTRGGIGTYGIALFSRYPILNSTRIDLRTPLEAEPRVAIDATVCAGSKQLRVIATHADVWAPQPGIDQLSTHLAQPVTTATLLMGDLNEQPTEAGVVELEAHGLHDVVGRFDDVPTYWSDNKRIDYVMADSTLNALATGAGVGTEHASDHLPVWADFDLSKMQ
jgi:endonuclease/exonuclease/phosphatase family metal-dependent hydrolase